MQIGFFGVLQLIFITLKLIDKIDWDWCWVLAPMWGPVMAFIMLCAAAIPVALFRAWRKSKVKSELYHD